jgi:hypothetical protein
VLFRKKDKPQERFYLFPGQGGRNYQRKQQRFMLWAIFAAVVCGSLVGAMMWWTERLTH